MSFIPIKPRKYKDGRTKQAFKDSTDVNRLLAKHAKAGTLSHLEQHGGHYGDFSGFDFQDAQNKLAQADEIFLRLPAEVRREFDQDPAKFFHYVNDPHKSADLAEKLPALAKPGRQMPTAVPSAAAGRASEPQANENQTPQASSADDTPAPTETGE